MGEVENMRGQLANACLKKSKELLESGDPIILETIDMISQLVDIAVKLDTLNLQWEQQSRFGVEACRGRLKNASSNNKDPDLMYLRSVAQTEAEKLVKQKTKG